MKIIETRSLTECYERLTENPSAIVGLEITEATLERTIAFWLKIAQAFPQALVLALCDRLPHATLDLCRELGAIDIMTSELDSMRLHDLVDRYLSQPAFETLKEDSDDLVGRIRSRLPWSATPSLHASR